MKNTAYIKIEKYIIHELYQNNITKHQKTNDVWPVANTIYFDNNVIEEFSRVDISRNSNQTYIYCDLYNIEIPLSIR